MGNETSISTPPSPYRKYAPHTNDIVLTLNDPSELMSVLSKIRLYKFHIHAVSYNTLPGTPIRIWVSPDIPTSSYDPRHNTSNNKDTSFNWQNINKHLNILDDNDVSSRGTHYHDYDGSYIDLLNHCKSIIDRGQHMVTATSPPDVLGQKRFYLIQSTATRK